LQIKQDHIVLIGLAILLGGFAWLVSISTGTEGGEDSFMHYLFARYVPQHPENLLDHWGKPLHTLLISPFAQFGFTGAKIYNVLAGMATAWFTYKTADRLGLKTAMASVIILLFAPLYFLCLNSALTEITFSLVLAAGLYFIVAEKYYAAAIILSFLPFARSEGFILLPFFGLYFIWQRQFIPMLFLATGVLLYSVIGYFWHYHDIMWVFNQNPYADKNQVYGRGYFWHYVDAHREIIGEPQKWLFFIGFVSFLLGLRRASHVGINNTDKSFQKWVLIVVLTLGYFFAHSIVWYYGIQGSAGLIRVFAGIMPLFALISTRGLDAIYKPFLLLPNLRLAIVCTILFFVVQYSTSNPHLPIMLGPEENTLYDAGNWYKQSSYKNQERKVYYFAPTVALAFDVDPFNPEGRAYLFDAKNTAEVPQGSLVVYDMHFGPNECKFPLEDIKGNPAFEQIHQITPKDSFSTLGGYNYAVYLFLKK
jgi:hypothetical protein